MFGSDIAELYLFLVMNLDILFYYIPRLWSILSVIVGIPVFLSLERRENPFLLTTLGILYFILNISTLLVVIVCLPLSVIAIYFVCAIVWFLITARIYSKSDGFAHLVEKEIAKNKNIDSSEIACNIVRNIPSSHCKHLIGSFFLWPFSILEALLSLVLVKFIEIVHNFLRSSVDSVLTDRQ